ncbi:MAG: hypothetical protein GDA49_00010 [Rhodospirillales bacterium]|nr:hypothetical protein [Rhodospirillales bacterium]
MSAPDRTDVEAEWRDVWFRLSLNTFLQLELVASDTGNGHRHDRMAFRREIGNMIRTDFGIEQAGIAPRLSETPGAIQRPSAASGARAYAILADFDFTTDEIAAQRRNGVIS